MTITPNWVFNLGKQPDIIRTVPLAEVMVYVGQFVVSGPVEIDWSDRYGWAALSLDQFGVFVHSFMDAVDNRANLD